MPQLRSRRHCRNKAAAATPDSPSSSGDLAADLAPGLLLDTDLEDPALELDADDPSFEPAAEETGSLPVAATSSFVPTPATVFIKSEIALQSQPAAHADPMDSSKAEAGLSAIASRICTPEGGVPDSSALGTDQHAAAVLTRTASNVPVKQGQVAATLQNAQKAGQDMLAPGEKSPVIRVSSNPLIPGWDMSIQCCMR